MDLGRARCASAIVKEVPPQSPEMFQTTLKPLKPAIENWCGNTTHGPRTGSKVFD